MADNQQPGDSLLAPAVLPRALPALHRRVVASDEVDPATLRSFGDVDATRRAIFDRALSAARGLSPVENQRYTLSLHDVDWADPEDVSIRAQKKAILEGNVIQRRLRGTWRLVDKGTGKVVSERKTTVAHVPNMTPRGTFVLNGADWALKNQMRLFPGVYHRIKETGEAEAHFNIMPGRGVGHRIEMEPSTGVFKLNIAQASIPLYPVLGALGATDSELRRVFGNELHAANKAKDDPRALDKLYQKLVRKADPSATVETKRATIKQAIEAMEMDPTVNQATLGHPFKHHGKDVILASVTKLLALGRGEAEADDRDHPAFQQFLGPEDLISERIARSRAVLQPLLWKATNTGNLDRFPVGALTKNVHGAIMDSGLGNPTEEPNQFDVFNQLHAVTRLGRGGISNTSAIPDESRSVSPGHLGYIDLVITPECYSSDMDVMTWRGWVAWPDVREDDLFACLVDGRLEYRRAEHLVTYDYSGPMYRGGSTLVEYLVTPNHRMWTRNTAGKWRFELPDKVAKSCRYLRIGHGAWAGGGTGDKFVLPAVASRRHDAGYGGDVSQRGPYRLSDFAALLGWYLSEGNVVYSEDKNRYRVVLSQVDTDNTRFCQRIGRLLSSMGIRWKYIPQSGSFVFHGRVLAAYFTQFGCSGDKWIPEEFLSADRYSRARLFAALLRGDGRRSKCGRYDIYTTTSDKLARDFQRLAFGLGYSTSVSTYVDKRQPHYRPCHEIHVHQRKVRVLDPRSAYCVHEVVDYTGKVYCATVPGGLLYVRRGDKGGFWCGNSMAAGVDLRMAAGAMKGADGQIYAKFRDMATGQQRYFSPRQLFGKTIAFSGELERNKSLVRATRDGNVVEVPPSAVDLAMDNFNHAFAPATQLIAAKSATKGQRGSMGARFLSQAVELTEPEAPLVQSRMPGTDKTYEAHYGKNVGALYARDVGGRVENVTPDAITVRYEDGSTKEHELYNEFPLNRKSRLHSTPLVQPGDRIKPGQLLAKSNFTDNNGNVALGRNLRVAYIAESSNFEDAFTISESAAKKLTSVQMYQHELDNSEGLKTSLKDFVSIFPAAYDRRTLSTLDTSGVVKPGTQVTKGSPLILAARPVTGDYKRVHSPHKGSFNDATVVWDHDHEGVVTDVARTEKGTVVVVKSLHPMVEADKLSGVYGDKGVVNILPDDRMPVDEQGRPFEVLANPNGVISRTNPGQVHVAVLGKIAEKTGKPYVLEDFDPRIDDLQAYVDAEARKHGVSSTETITDPVTGRRIPNVATGVRYYLKLHHMADYKAGARGLGSHTSEGVPARGGEHGCFAPGQLVQTLHGKMKIARLCEKRLGVQVLTYSFDRSEWTYRPVTDWFTYRAKVSDLITIKTTDGRAMHVTRNHVVFTASGKKVEAGSLVVGDALAVAGPVPNAYQLDLMYGSLLGDAYAGGGVFSCEHSVKQSAYAKWKQTVLAGVGAIVHYGRARKNSFHGKVYQSTATQRVRVYSPFLCDDMRRLCYSGPAGKKVVTDEWLDRVDGLGVAVWVLDDGSLTNRAKKRGRVVFTGKIATHGFTDACREKLASWLEQRYGESCTVCVDGSLYLSPGLAKALVYEVARWVPWHVIPKSKPFLRRYARRLQDTEAPVVVVQPCQLGLVPIAVKSISPYRHPIPDIDVINVYDFTVAETHNYCASRVLVSNSKKLAVGDVGALLSSGALEVIKDGRLVRGAQNPEFWAQFMAGYKPATPPVPFVYDKFVNQLRAAGLNVTRKGSDTHLMAMTDKAVTELAGDRNIENADTVDWRNNLRPLAGGLFDDNIFGGHAGRRWGAIKLHEPMPNPAFEVPILKVLGLTEKRYRDVLAGKERMGGTTGPQAIQQALAAIDVPKAIEQCRRDIASSRATLRDAAIRRFGYLKGCEKTGIHPKEWVLSRVPVLPPVYRPVSIMQDTGGTLVADSNQLYKELFDANDVLGTMKGRVDDLSEHRLAVYDAFKAVTGLGEPIQPKSKEKGLQGILREVLGSSAKFSAVQQRLLGTPVNVVGRGVIRPDADLTMDEVGIPEKQAWEVYAPFVVRSMVQRGIGRTRAMELVESQDKLARQFLVEEMGRRPVLLTRAPILHRYGNIGLWPRLVKGASIKLNHFVYKGLGADNDGNCVVGSTKIVLRIDRCLIYDVPHAHASWSEDIVRLIKKHRVALSCDGVEMTIPIEEFPRRGVPETDRNGALVYAVPAGIEVLTYDVKTGAALFSPVTHVTIEKDHPCARVETRRGRSVEVSTNESLAVYDAEKDDLVRVTPEAAIGRLVPFVRHRPRAGADFTFAHGWWYGALVSDGWVRDGSMVGYSKNDQAKREEFVRLARVLFPHIDFTVHEYFASKAINPSKYGDAWKLHINSVEVASRVFSVYHDGASGALNKQLPRELLQAGSEQCLWGLLCGLLDGDGFVRFQKNKSRSSSQFTARMHTSSPWLRDDIYDLLQRLGLRYSTTTKAAQANSAEGYSITISTRDFYDAASNFVFIDQESKEAVAKLKAGGRPQENNDIVPIKPTLAAALARCGTTKDMSVYGALRDAVSRSYISRDMARRAMAVPGAADVEGAAAWQAAFVEHEDVHWDIFVRSQMTRAQTVYDLAVPATKVFATDHGLIVWDTCNFHVPTTDEAREEAINKLLPSASLFNPQSFDKPAFFSSQEDQGGLWVASRPARKDVPVKTFATKKDALRALAKGELHPNDPIEIIQHD